MSFLSANVSRRQSNGVWNVFFSERLPVMESMLGNIPE